MLVIEGPKLATVMNQVKKLEVSVLVVGQRRPSFLSWWVDSNRQHSNFIHGFSTHFELKMWFDKLIAAFVGAVGLEIWWNSA